jgi:hypothetical protein
VRVEGTSGVEKRVPALLRQRVGWRGCLSGQQRGGGSGAEYAARARVGLHPARGVDAVPEEAARGQRHSIKMDSYKVGERVSKKKSVLASVSARTGTFSRVNHITLSRLLHHIKCIADLYLKPQPGP